MIRAEQAPVASATGIFLCLRQLAEEAATLNLPHTLFAIEQALAVVANEAERGPSVGNRH
jgi:hypothetical protein